MDRTTKEAVAVAEKAAVDLQEATKAMEDAVAELGAIAEGEGKEEGQPESVWTVTEYCRDLSPAVCTWYDSYRTLDGTKEAVEQSYRERNLDYGCLEEDLQTIEWVKDEVPSLSGEEHEEWHGYEDKGACDATVFYVTKTKVS